VEAASGLGAALSLSFDNLGEAAEARLGATALPEGRGEHFTALEPLPRILAALAERSLEATFFVEGVNAALYPDALREIAAAGHEVGYHAWCHEDWGGLTAAEQADNLARGLAAFERLGLATTGMRPPGGLLGGRGAGTIADAGLRYCSPAGSGTSREGDVALVPFEWRHVDAACVLPPLAPVRERIAGSPAPLEPARFVEWIGAEIDRLPGSGGHLNVVLHPFMVERWLGDELLGELLDSVAAAGSDGVSVAPCGKVAERVLAAPRPFAGVTTLDRASWSASGGAADG
jgi:Polysaccharide deacetylase